jgi:predicted amidohydrolase YtcJ
MLAPYEPHPDYPEDFRGHLHVGEATLCRDLLEFERRGFTVKLHTAGDHSVRAALDAIESAHRASGRSDLRHELAHAGFIDPADLPRFRELNAVADLSPYMWYPSPIMNSVRGALGKRADRYWPIRDLLESGAPLLAGSDWSAAVESMDPWIGIASMVTRRDPKGRSPGALWPEQAISLERELEIFVAGGARSLRRASQTGSIEIGKSADLIALDRNLFAIPPEQISETEVELTLFAGQIVHRA